MAGKILYNNLLRAPGASNIIHSMPTGYSPDDVIDGRTSTFGKFDAGTNRGMTWDLGAVKTFDSLAIARHNFDASTFITVAVSANGVDWANIYSNYNIVYEKNLYLDLGTQTY